MDIKQEDHVWAKASVLGKLNQSLRRQKFDEQLEKLIRQVAGAAIDSYRFEISKL